MSLGRKIKGVVFAFCGVGVAFVNLGFAAIDKHIAQAKTVTEQSDNLLTQIVGPFGALVLSVILLYIVGRYMARLIKRNDNIQQDRIKEYQDRIEDLERQLKQANER